jgi:predicted DCC family thiol-disulfide oxidoreductase YuxK
MAKLEVLYNSECPVCDKEIKHYEKISRGQILYTPISVTSLGSWGLSESEAAEKLHARLDGKEMVGVDAFLEIWSRLPYYRILSRFVKMPPIKVMANIVYSKVLAPILYSLHRSRQKKVPRKNV